MSTTNIPNYYVNEGFLFINNNTKVNDSKNKSFEKSKIIDIEGKLVCLGEIIYNNSRKDFLECVKKNYINHYSPLYKGTRIRIYWYDDRFNISTINQIYPNIDISKYINQINFDLLDKKICYYAIMCDDIPTIILTYMEEITKKMKKNINNIVNVNLKIPVLSEDLAFENHLEIFDCKNPFMILDQIQLHNHGLMFYSNCGINSEVFEFVK